MRQGPRLREQGQKMVPHPRGALGPRGQLLSTVSYLSECHLGVNSWDPLAKRKRPMGGRCHLPTVGKSHSSALTSAVRLSPAGARARPSTSLLPWPAVHGKRPARVPSPVATEQCGSGSLWTRQTHSLHKFRSSCSSAARVQTRAAPWLASWRAAKSVLFLGHPWHCSGHTPSCALRTHSWFCAQG